MRGPASEEAILSYKYHPLLTYVKQQHPAVKNSIFHIRGQENDEELSTLILKPVARAIAGPNGKAMATPHSKAVVRKGTNVVVFFEPEAIAIAGPGGIAHAESDLEISYEDD